MTSAQLIEDHRPSTRHRGRIILYALPALLLAACSGQQSGAGPATVQGQAPDGTVEMHEVQAAYIGSGSAGGGTLNFRGRTYPFKVGGVGIGGIGLSTIEARGEVYQLQSIEQFPGTYAQGRYGFAIGTASGGDLWLKNDSGVVMHLVAKREGLMLSLGADAIEITMGQ
ncbi:hypothetical protein FFK22_021490 [Mycobacterium sp. KBS0706]|uniref:hypothetical protein n=1 Tax=Mycobacterium sp. KBS0706 TaxID=2578109 RepID=UPI00110FF38D|nr:hypothetical protein [Mycobacterium sp. KBS0706]TSD86606.1 hypothetical protein FFK22_021490 [Mycobacterium sp. KBS0706]